MPILLLSLVLAMTSPGTAIAQGCSSCRDATAGSAPQARRSLRIAIPLLAIPAVGIFALAVVLARRIKPGSNSDIA